jgi:glycosyltransferase involved in cell wall biosynthesis
MNQSSLSVIIPTLNEAAHLDPLLNRLVDRPGIEVIVVDGGSTDDTERVVAKYPSVSMIHSAQGRGIQLNQGAEAAKFESFWFLHADSTIPPGWMDEIHQALKEPQVVAGCFRLQFDDNHCLLRLFSFFSRWNH